MNKKLLRTLCSGLCFAATLSSAQTLSPKWEDLTSADFVKAIAKADGVCLLPMGSVEKFGPSAPLGTNVYLVRLIPMEAAKQEYFVMFPSYFVAQTGDTSTLPGTIHYSMDMQLQFLKETTDEMARNGCRKIILGNGHTGNNPLIQFFMANLTDKSHNYAVYNIYVSGFPVFNMDKLPAVLRPSRPGADGHGGEERVAAILAYYPDLIHLDRAHDESASAGHLDAPGQGGPGGSGGANQPIAGSMSSLPTGYSGDAGGATAERGKALVQYATDKLVTFVRAVKADKGTLDMQRQFYERFEHPLGGPSAK